MHSCTTNGPTARIAPTRRARLYALALCVNEAAAWLYTSGFWLYGGQLSSYLFLLSRAVVRVLQLFPSNSYIGFARNIETIIINPPWLFQSSNKHRSLILNFNLVLFQYTTLDIT
jgi:hypothetical protein